MMIAGSRGFGRSTRVSRLTASHIALLCRRLAADSARAHRDRARAALEHHTAGFLAQTRMTRAARCYFAMTRSIARIARET